MFERIGDLLDLAFHPVVLALLIIAGAVYGVWQIYDRHKAREDRKRLLARPGMRIMSTTPGLAEFDALPRGDRRNGTRHGVARDLDIEVAGQPQTVTVAAFEWWWEVRRRDTSSRSYRGARMLGRDTSHLDRYSTESTVAFTLEIPIEVPDLLIKPASLVTRAGMVQRGLQVESNEFNRRFVVHADVEAEAVRLLDAHLQDRLVRSFDGRTIEFRRGRVVVAGTPDHRDDSLHGVIGDLPALLEDGRRFASSLPAFLWRNRGSGTIHDGR